MKSFHSFAGLMEENEIKEKILRGAAELFLKYGVRSITMDEIARHLGISKKTLYQYFTDKDDIVATGTLRHLEKERKELEEIATSSSNSVEELVRLSYCVRANLQGMNPSLLFDLQKYHQKAWKIWLDYKSNIIRNSVVRNLKKGIVDGLFREDLDPEVLAILRLETVQLGFDEDLFPRDRFRMPDVQLQILEHFIFGLLTDKGRKLYQKHKSKLNQPSITTN